MLKFKVKRSDSVKSPDIAKTTKRARDSLVSTVQGVAQSFAGMVVGSKGDSKDNSFRRYVSEEYATKGFDYDSEDEVPKNRSKSALGEQIREMFAKSPLMSRLKHPLVDEYSCPPDLVNQSSQSSGFSSVSQSTTQSPRSSGDDDPNSGLLDEVESVLAFKAELKMALHHDDTPVEGDIYSQLTVETERQAAEDAQELARQQREDMQAALLMEIAMPMLEEAAKPKNCASRTLWRSLRLHGLRLSKDSTPRTLEFFRRRGVGFSMHPDHSDTGSPVIVNLFEAQRINMTKINLGALEADISEHSVRAFVQQKEEENARLCGYSRYNLDKY